MGKFEDIANHIVTYKLKTSWLSIEKFYNEVAARNDASLAMAFVLMAINNEKGSPVTSIAPRIGMEPNSLSRILKSLIERGYVYKDKKSKDKRKVYICLTPKGIEKQKIALENVFFLETQIKLSLSDSDLEGFFKVTNAINTTIENIKGR